MGLPLPSISVESIRPNMDDGEKRLLVQQQLEMVTGMAEEAKVRVRIKRMNGVAFTPLRLSSSNRWALSRARRCSRRPQGVILQRRRR
jgi:type VI protein secretion system component VasA